MIFLDANIFIRFLVADNNQKAKDCKRLFERIEQEKIEATFSESILTEVVYWLSSRSKHGYGLSPAEIAEKMIPLITLKGMQLSHREIYLNALTMYAANPFLDLEDALSIAHMQRLKIKTITSYDTDFDRLPTITRQEP